MSCLINLYIRDKDLNVIRRIGDNPHDMLTINDEGQLCYCNLQNGGGCRTGEFPSDWYEFVCNEDMYGYNIDPREDGNE